MIMKEKLFDFVKDYLPKEDMYKIIEAYEEWRTSDGEENIYDLELESDRDFFVNLYGEQTMNRCRKIERYWIAGTSYYANVLDKNVWRNLEIKPLNHVSMLDFTKGVLDEFEDMFADYVIQYDTDIKKAIGYANSAFNYIIDFEGYAKFKFPEKFNKKTYTFNGNVDVNINKVKVEAYSEEEAMELAKEEIKKSFTFYGDFDTSVEKRDISITIDSVSA